MGTKSLLSQQSPLVRPEEQFRVMNEPQVTKFVEKMKPIGLSPLKPTQIDIFQINVGKLCNQTCKHCHVDAGPDRREIMTKETMIECLTALEKSGASTVDLTGGAPEMVPHFRWFVEEIRKQNKKVIVRCNLTIITANPSYHDLPQFFATNKVHVASSLPYYDKRNTDRQRGDGVFDKSIQALKMLNEVGYGKEGTGLELDLVYNPVGAFLPAPQAGLELDFKRELRELFGIVFNQLYTITNMPISRFLEYLLESGNLSGYMEKLVNSFNPAAAKGVMCRNTISIGWDGFLYDCDFNQMLEMKIKDGAGKPMHIRNSDWKFLNTHTIQVDQHCYGCTAGAGSSCGGSTA